MGNCQFRESIIVIWSLFTPKQTDIFVHLRAAQKVDNVTFCPTDRIVRHEPSADIGDDDSRYRPANSNARQMSSTIIERSSRSRDQPG